MNKVVTNADEAIKDIEDGAVLMLGGFGLCGLAGLLADQGLLAETNSPEPSGA